MPPSPSIQITTKAAKATSSAMTATPSAPAKVASAGWISSRPERTMMTASKEATNANPAMRRAQIASREVGSVVDVAARHRPLTNPSKRT